jgi:hypothetical protein
MKKISFNSITYVLLHIVLFVFLFVVTIDIFIIVNDLMGNETMIENIDNRADKIFNYGSK